MQIADARLPLGETLGSPYLMMDSYSAMSVWWEYGSYLQAVDTVKACKIVPLFDDATCLRLPGIVPNTATRLLVTMPGYY